MRTLWGATWPSKGVLSLRFYPGSSHAIAKAYPLQDRLGACLLCFPSHIIRLVVSGLGERRLKEETPAGNWWVLHLMIYLHPCSGSLWESVLQNTLLWYLLFPCTCCWKSNITGLDGPLVCPHVTDLTSPVLHQFPPLLIYCVASTAVTGHGTTEGNPTSSSLPHCDLKGPKVVPIHALHEADRWVSCPLSLRTPHHACPSLLLELGGIRL